MKTAGVTSMDIKIFYNINIVQTTNSACVCMLEQRGHMTDILKEQPAVVFFVFFLNTFFPIHCVNLHHARDLVSLALPPL